MDGLESNLVTKSSSASMVMTQVLISSYRSCQLGSFALGKDTLIHETPVSNLLRRAEPFFECLPRLAALSEALMSSALSTDADGSPLSPPSLALSTELPLPIPISPSWISPVDGFVSSNARHAFGSLYQSAPVMDNSSAVPLRPTNTLSKGRRSDSAGNPRGTPCLVRMSSLSSITKVGMKPSMEMTAPSSLTLTSRPLARATPMHCGAGGAFPSSPSFLSTSPFLPGSLFFFRSSALSPSFSSSSKMNSFKSTPVRTLPPFCSTTLSRALQTARGPPTG
mmetsp:Transcript_23480/g.51054  ORF Transcript_23480/g.51054 Transcript_23480/m.51054 type:complete len:280 (-) Transcript_23480:1493-2332(-)